MKKLLIIGVAVLAGLWVAKRVHLASYANTLWCQVSQSAKAQVPTKFELERIRNEIARMDGQIQGMVGPIAEHMTAIGELQKDIDRTRTALAGKKTRLLALSESVKNGDLRVSFEGRNYALSAARRKLDREFSTYKADEAQLATKEKILEAKEQALEATRGQLDKLISKKREFEVRVAALEVRYEQLEAAKIGSDIRVDDGLATEIATGLKEIEHQLAVAENKLRLLNGGFPHDRTRATEVEESTIDPAAVQNYLHGKTEGGTTKTAQR
jgi:chromosome segregation ATPase